MDAIERQIAAYHATQFKGNGEAPEKIAALEALESFLPDDRVLEFFLRVVADPAEYDMARVHLLQLFESDPGSSSRQRVGECMVATLPAEPDWTVRCWLGRVVGCYSEVPEARAVAISRTLDPTEDDDVRHNCLAGRWTSCRDADTIAVLQQLSAENSLLGRAARDRLVAIVGHSR